MLVQSMALPSLLLLLFFLVLKRTKKTFMASEHEHNRHAKRRELQNVSNQINLTSNNINACAKVDMSFKIVLFCLVTKRSHSGKILEK